jgi:hypothetical protein
MVPTGADRPGIVAGGAGLALTPLTAGVGTISALRREQVECRRYSTQFAVHLLPFRLSALEATAAVLASAKAAKAGFK